MSGQLSKEKGEIGNGNFPPDNPPDFKRDSVLFFPLGEASLSNDGDAFWIIRGPGRIYSEGDIRIRGRIRLEEIHLLSGQSIVFEDSVIGRDLSAYARKNTFVNDRCDLEIEAVAGKHIILRGTSQTQPGSILLSIGNVFVGKPGDSLSTIQLQDKAVFRGMLIAEGPLGTAVLRNPGNRVQGVTIAKSAKLAGAVEGAVIAGKLKCDDMGARNCLGKGTIDRTRLPPDFAQPLALGPQDRRQYVFKLMNWKRLK